VSSTRVHGAAAQSRSRSIRWAGKQEKLRPQEKCFFLTSPFIELLGTWLSLRRSCSSFLASLAVPKRGVVASQDPGSRNVRAQETAGLESAAFLDWPALA
jgi:hypothetical protein